MEMEWSETDREILNEKQRTYEDSTSLRVPAGKLRTYWWRWLVLSEFVVLLGLNNALWITFAPIADVMTCYYETSNFWINSLSMIYMVTYIVFVLPSSLMLSRLGLRTTFIMSACANAAGACLRWAGSGKNSRLSDSTVMQSLNLSLTIELSMRQGFYGPTR